ncbi:MAG: polysaccharide pyruvyl transferase family protein [Streptosporangiales bacterium]|nr:polysaccharide pyruvyl transferase family protein [Streptosporangiales bacterium]
MRVLIAGWPSFVHGEATAGDVLSMEAVEGALTRAGVACETAWSPVFRPGHLRLDDAPAEHYTHVVFVCGPVHGEQLRALHRRYARCRRIAVDVSVTDPDDAAAAGFDVLLPRDRAGAEPRRDLSALPDPRPVPVVGVILAPEQPEYGRRRRHGEVTARLTAWLKRQDCVRVPVDTRLDRRDWRRCGTEDQLASLIRRLDSVVTTRLHGLVLGLSNGVAALAVDPVAGGAKVSAQARAWSWPAIVTADALPEDESEHERRLRGWFDWCLSPAGRSAAWRRSASADPGRDPLLGDLLRCLLGRG